jgi:hypothetical protein
VLTHTRVNGGARADALLPLSLPRYPTQGMHEELAQQNKELDALDNKATATRDRINDVNKNSQLRNMGGWLAGWCDGGAVWAVGGWGLCSMNATAGGGPTRTRQLGPSWLKRLHWGQARLPKRECARNW